jgi:20S proteasome alpha/beta subunit
MMARRMLMPKPPRPFQPKPRRLPERKRMTLIAALPYQDGVVIAADSLEAVGDYKVGVDKIRPVQCGNWVVIFGGSGNDGPLIDVLEQRIQSAIRKHKKGDIADTVRKEVLDFNKTELAAHPAPPDNKRIEGILCITSMNGGTKPRLFLVSGSVILESDDCLLVGWDAALYKNLVKRTYSSAALVNQGVGLALELFRLANDTCMWVGGPTKLYVVTDSYVFEEEQEDIAAVEQRLTEVTKRLNDILRSCPDGTTHPRVLENQLDWFRHEIIGVTC